MERELEMNLSSLLFALERLEKELSAHEDAFSEGSLCLTAEERESIVEALDEAGDCLIDAQNCVEEALETLKDRQATP